MRHAIVVVGSKVQRDLPVPELSLRGDEPVKTRKWYANRRQKEDAVLFGDIGSVVVRSVLAPVLAYELYTLVHNTKLWSGSRPLLIICGRDFASRIAAYAGTWGGGDVVWADGEDKRPPGPARFVLQDDGRLRLFGEAADS